MLRLQALRSSTVCCSCLCSRHLIHNSQKSGRGFYSPSSMLHSSPYHAKNTLGRHTVITSWKHYPFPSMLDEILFQKELFSGGLCSSPTVPWVGGELRYTLLCKQQAFILLLFPIHSVWCTTIKLP